MKTNVLTIYGAVIIVHVVFGDIHRRDDYLRNFYDDYETHETRTRDFLRKRRQIDDDSNRKLTKIERCRRYAQLYQQNYGGVGCYYQFCRQSYCGYCPTSSCRRRCPYNCSYTTGGTTRNQQTATTASIRECRCDKDGSKIEACDQTTGQCKCKPHYKGLKCDQCESGYWKNGKACVPCDCNPNGSIDSICDQQTGLCVCKSGVQGQKCDSCREKYFGDVVRGCKACDPCDRPGHICHPQTGKCVCPQLTVGPKCERCEENAWGLEPGIGCKGCDCSKTGSVSGRCDSITGRCTCRQGFEGEKCEKCSFGFFAYPTCQKCNCNVAGTLQEDCRGKFCNCNRDGCRCKENVEGKFCNHCKTGTFGLDVSNSKGCVDCFCFGRSKTCSASSLTWDQIRTNDLTHVTAEECSRKCWRLPEKFSGDLVDSYGGHLRILSNSPQNRVFLNGNGIVLEGVTDRTGDLKLEESYWKFRTSSHPLQIPRECTERLTRPCLMVVLQRVSRILVQPVQQVVRFDEVLLDKISNVGGIITANTIEQCKCPKQYTSSSCQDPNTGYYRYYPKETESNYTYIDRMVGVAKPCQCNNRSKLCDKQTGHCLNCTDNTVGTHCQNCAEGYYEDASGKCSPCLCPTRDRNFAKSCTLIARTKEYKCECKEGYSGLKCDECEDQFWGSPNKVNGFCQPCNCNPYGSINLLCHQSTGMCACKPGFTGLKCSKCVDPRQVIQNGVCIYCDECTQKLFNVIDDMSLGLNHTLDTFKNGLGPPWGLFNSTVHRCNLLTKRFEEMERIQDIMRNANVPELEKRIDKIKKDLLERKEALESQAKIVDRMQKETRKLPEDVQMLSDQIQAIIKRIDKFSKTHVNVHDALREAEEILEEISAISNSVPPLKYYQDKFDKCQKLVDDIDDIYATNTSTNKITSMLTDLKNRLDDFDLILGRTVHVNELVERKNELNTIDIRNLNRTINEINAKDASFKLSYSDLLKKISTLDNLLESIESVYRNLSAINVQNTTTQIGQDTIEPLYDSLSVAREFVKTLRHQVKSNENLFNFTREEWDKIDASSAYKNISREIKLAKEEAQRARDTVANTVNTLYPLGEDSLVDKSNLAKAFSDRIQKRVFNLKNLTEDFKQRAEDLDNLKHAILSNGKNNNELNSVLHDTRVKIGMEAEKIRELEKIKRDATNVSSLIDSIDRGIKDTNISVQYDLTKMYYKFLDLASSDDVAELNRNIDKTRGELQRINLSQNLTAIDRIRKTNELNFKATKERFDAIQEKIKQLLGNIKYANELVEAVEYGVDVGNCKRHYQLNSEIFRSLKINFKCKVCDLFNLTNSHKEQIHVRYANGFVHVLWKNQNYSVRSTNSISIERLDSKIEMKGDETKAFYDDEPFQIENKHWLQVGNIDSTNTLEACVHKLILNGQSLGLWRFKLSEGHCPGCVRNISEDSLEDVFFHGDGYRNVLDRSVKNLNPSNLYFKFSFATFDENSLLFLSQDRTNSCSFIAIKLDDGRLQLQVRHNNGLYINSSTQGRYNNGKSTIVEVSMNWGDRTQQYSLKVLSPIEETVDIPGRNLPKQNVYKIRKSDIFIGGVTGNFSSTCLPFGIVPFLGNLKLSERLKVTSENTLSYHVEPKTGDIQYRNARFRNGGFVNLEVEPDKSVSLLPISFFFIPATINNNFVMSINSFMTILLRNSSLVFKINNETEFAFDSVCANSSHYVKITETNIRMNNVVKNVSIAANPITSDKITLHLGKADQRSFVGSMSDIFLNNKPVLFTASTVKNFKNVEIGRDNWSALSSKNECVKEMQNTERYSRIPEYKTEPQAFKFGDKSDSFIFVKNVHAGKKSVVEFQFRTFYPNGLLLLSNYVTPKNISIYLVLEIQGGDLRIRVQGHRIKTMNVNNKINDGLWHHVQVEQIVGKKKLRIVVKLDKKWKIKERLAKSASAALYIGGLINAPGFNKKLRNELHPFRGCIRALKINRNSLEDIKNNNVFYNNIGQCFQNVEEGAYFGGDAFAIYKYDFKISKYLELSFEFKTGEPNGILLSISSAKNSPALSVELQNGAVVMTIDMGNGIVSKVTNSPHADSSLADNEWHNITALYSSSELTVNIDGVRKSWVQSDMGAMVDEIQAPLYLGGLPNNVPSGTLKIKENFKGCIRKFKIEDNIMDWTDMKKLNNVQLNSCLS